MEFKKNKLLFIIGSLAGGGAEKTLIEILNVLPENKYNITLLLLKREGVNLSDVPKHIKICSIITPKNGSVFSKLYNKLLLFWLRFLLFFPELIQKYYLKDSFHYMIAFLQYSELRVLKIKRSSIKIVRICNNINMDNTNLKLLSSALKTVDKVWCISKEMINTVAYNFPMTKEKIVLIQNPRNIKNIHNIALKNEITFVKPTIVAVGRLEKQKRFDILLRALALLLKEGNDWNLNIIGIGSLDKELKNLVDELGIGNNVEFIGYTKNPYSYIKSANLFVLSSENEGFCNVLIEALALSCPIVATDCISSPKEILENGKYGYLVKVNSVVDLANGIKIVMQDKKIIENFKRNGFMRAMEFDTSMILPKLEQLFDSVPSKN